MTHPLGRQAISVNQPPFGGTGYPFVDPSEDILRLLGDFYLSYRDPDCRFILPLRIDWLYGFGSNIVANFPGYPTPTHNFDIIVVDSNNERVFDSTEASIYLETVWSSRLTVIEWRTDTVLCRCTLHTDWSPQDIPLVYDLYIKPASGELDSRTYERMPASVTSLTIDTVSMEENIVFEEGYNLDFLNEAGARRDGTRFVNRIFVNPTPGGGIGRKTGCDDAATFIRRINNITADASGNFNLEIAECFRSQLLLKLRKPYTPWTGATEIRTADYKASGFSPAQARGAIKIYNDCEPCCSCDDFVHTYLGLKHVWDIWKDVANLAEHVRDIYAQNRERWLAQKECRIANSSRIVLESQGSCVLYVGVGYCNYSDCCLTNVELRLTFQLYNGTTEIAPPGFVRFLDAQINGVSSTPIIVSAAAGWPIYRFFIDSLSPRELVVLRTHLLIPCDEGYSVKVTFTGHAADPSGAEDTCGLSTFTPPAEILAIWSAYGVSGDPVRTITAKATPLN